MEHKEKYRNARAFIVLLAALIALLLNIKYDRELVQSLIIVIVVIVIFYIISTIAIKLIDKIRNMEVVQEITDTPSSDEEENNLDLDSDLGE